MRKGISITVTLADRVRLQSIIRDRNSLQKHVWRARIIILTADGEDTTAVMRAVGKGKTVVWRWQERFMRGGRSNGRGPDCDVGGDAQHGLARRDHCAPDNGRGPRRA